MTPADRLFELPRDPEAFAFVLRVRTEPSTRTHRTVVALDDVTAGQSWHFTSLEAAFAKIRTALDRHAGEAQSEGKPKA